MAIVMHIWVNGKWERYEERKDYRSIHQDSTLPEYLEFLASRRSSNGISQAYRHKLVINGNNR